MSDQTFKKPQKFIRETSNISDLDGAVTRFLSKSQVSSTPSSTDTNSTGNSTVSSNSLESLQDSSFDSKFGE